MGALLFDRAKDLHNQDAVMRNNGPATLAYAIRMRYLLRIAHIRDVINDVLRIFLEGVVCGTVKRGTAPVIVYSQPDPDIDGLHLESHVVNLGVKTRSFLNCIFDG